MNILKESFKLRDDKEKPVEYTAIEKIDSGEIKHHFSYFACTCDDADRQYWKQKVHDYMPEFDPEIHADIVSQLSMEINHTYNGSITIDSDMWFGISVQCCIWNEEYTENEQVHINMYCDEVSLGLMAVVELLKKVVPDA